jgi:hypothetical protein
MNFELTEQSIQFTFGNKKYKSGLKNPASRMCLRMRKLMLLKMWVRRLPVCKTIHLMM